MVNATYGLSVTRYELRVNQTDHETQTEGVIYYSRENRNALNTSRPAFIVVHEKKIKLTNNNKKQQKNFI